MAEFLCQKCVGGTSGVLITDVLDGCGNCIHSGRPCHCNGKADEDVCGVCNGEGKTCVKLIEVSPLVVPAMMKTEVCTPINGFNLWSIWRKNRKTFLYFPSFRWK
ncbi:uncharacterized protein LOC111087861 [Limulus polyphemus]|uniref:Uncharacterized protein LOC111087861 n=1 Tax=Limulus polyphemus TaxID=6850 RepID=A0ABM1T780_LIMPO|nr:uncharacterized protein LOC111087861 [Limulus polyphemus]